ncbi:MAG TPA: pyridoxal phosphate-dependent aminotransferase [Candidatus Poseidoniaceae archaeon]|jgi:aspartate/methionine/tyrosine aminotransferase|nr:pyridoxal phosphate-dependent aminotransferase [Candidatus Poseidoniaceae archaeon]
MPSFNKNIDAVGVGFASFFTAPPEDVIRFTVGQPDFVTPEKIRNTAIKSLENGETFYTRQPGSESLCGAVAKYLNDEFNINAAMERILIAPGCKQTILYALMGLGNPGDEIMLLSPSWATYDAQIKLLGMTPIHVPVRRDNYHPDFEKMEAAISEKTSMILINSPNNPTGAVYTPKEIEQIIEFAERNDLWILSDEIYATMTWMDWPHVSPASLPGGFERTIVIGGWSKSWAMTGWRLGFLSGPENAMSALFKCHANAATHVPTFLMPAAEIALSCSDEVAEMTDAFRTRRERIIEKLKGINGLHVPTPEGAFYVLMDVTGTGMDDMTFAKRALEEARVHLIPGSLMEKGEGLVRISYATSIENIDEGCSRLKKWLNNL